MPINFHFKNSELDEAFKKASSSYDKLFCIRQELCTILNRCRRCALPAHKIGMCIVFGPSGAGKTTLFSACCHVFPFLNIRHFVLPSDISSESKVISTLSNCSDNADDFGRKLARFISLNAGVNPKEFPTFHKLAAAVEVANLSTDSCIRMTEPFILLHDTGDVVSDSDKKIDHQNANQNVSINSVENLSAANAHSLSPPVLKKRRLDSVEFQPRHPDQSSPTTTHDQDDLQDKILDDANNTESPSVFACEGSMSLPSVQFPLTMSDSCLKAVYDGDDYPPDVKFLLGMMKQLGTDNKHGALVNFNTSMSLQMKLEVDNPNKMRLLEESYSQRVILYKRLYPAGEGSQTYCFHQYVHDGLKEALNFANLDDQSLNFILARILGIALVESEVSMQRCESMLARISELQESESNVSNWKILEDVLIGSVFERSLNDPEKQNISRLLSTCSSQDQKRRLCCKVIMAAFSDVRISMGCHAARDAVNYSVLRVTTSDVNSLDVNVRMDFRFLPYMMKTFVLTSEACQNEKSVNLINNCVSALLEAKTPSNLLVAEPAEAVIFGSKFEQCIFSRIVLMLYCCRESFDRFPSNCFGPRELLQLGKISETHSSGDTPDAFPVGQRITKMKICSRENSLDGLCEALAEFVKPPVESNKLGLRFFVARTPYVTSVDVVVACANLINGAGQEMDQEVTVWILECKSSQMSRSNFESVDLQSLLSNGKSAFNKVLEAATHSGSPPTIEYCIQLLNRPLVLEKPTRESLTRDAKKSSFEPFSAVRFMLYEASANSSVHLPGLLASSDPETYLPSDCCCGFLAKALANAKCPSPHREPSEYIEFD